MFFLATKEYNCPTDALNVLVMVALLIHNLSANHETHISAHVIGTSCFCSTGSALSCGVYTTLTGAFLQEDDLGLWEEVGTSDDHFFSPTNQTAGQVGFLNLGQLLS